MGSVYEEITRLETAKADIETAIEGCGVNVPDTDLISTYAQYIRQIPSAVFSELNVDPVGGEDMYIKSIEQKDGLINATTGGLVSSTSSGLSPKIGTSASSTIIAQANEWVLTSTNGGSPSWRKLPSNAFKNDNTNTTYSLSGALSANTYITTLTDSASGKTTATIPAMSGASSTAAGTAGLVPAPEANKHTAFLRGDGTWAVPTNYYRPISVNGTSILENNNTTLNLVAGASISITAENSSGYTGKVTITNTGVRSTTINGNYLRVNTNGTNADLTIPYATSAGSLGGYNISNFMVYADYSDYVAASFTDKNLSKKATEKCIEYWDSAGWFNSAWGQVTANYGFVGNLTGTASYANSAGSAGSANGLASTGYGNNNLTYYQTSGEFFGNSGWTHYIIANHGDGSSDYNFTIGLPFQGVPIYKRLEGGGADGWHTFITSENIGSQSVNYASSAGSVAWGNITGKPSTFTPSSHTHTYIESKANYTFTSSTLPNSFDWGVSAGFVADTAGYGSWGSVLTVRTYTGGGGTLQLYAPYSNTYGGSRLKARFGNYDSNNGNSWTTLKEIAWTSDIPTKISQLTNDSGYLTNLPSHNHSYLPLSGGTMNTTAQILAYTKSKGSSDIYNGAIQLREATGSATSCTDNMYDAPGITFHWAGKWVHKLNMHTDALYWDNNKLWHAGNDGSGSGLDADTVDSLHASAFAKIGTYNNLTHEGNEFTFASSAFSGHIWFNYRTASGSTDGNITKYCFGNGKGGALAYISNGYFSGTAAAANSVTCTEAYGDTPRPIVGVVNNSLYYTSKVTIRWDNGNVTAPTFTGRLIGSADQVDGYHISVVTSLPATKVNNTIYILV